MQRLFSFFWQNKFIFYSALIAGCVIAFSPPQSGIQPDMNDKFLHVVGFLVMAILCHIAHPNLPLTYQFMGLAMFGIGVETVQAYLPYRTFSLADFVADLAGILIYQLFIAPHFMRFLRYRFAPD